MSRRRSLTLSGLVLLLMTSGSACSGSDDSSSGDGSGPDLAVFCELAPKIISGATSGDPAQLGAALRLAKERGSDLSDNSPPNIRKDAVAFVQGLAGMQGALKDVGYDASRIEPDRAAALMTPEFQASVQGVQGAVASACGGAGSDAGTTTVPG